MATHMLHQRQLVPMFPAAYFTFPSRHSQSVSHSLCLCSFCHLYLILCHCQRYAYTFFLHLPYVCDCQNVRDHIILLFWYCLARGRIFFVIRDQGSGQSLYIETISTNPSSIPLLLFSSVIIVVLNTCSYSAIEKIVMPSLFSIVLLMFMQIKDCIAANWDSSCVRSGFVNPLRYSAANKLPSAVTNMPANIILSSSSSIRKQSCVRSICNVEHLFVS